LKLPDQAAGLKLDLGRHRRQGLEELVAQLSGFGENAEGRLEVSYQTRWPAVRVLARFAVSRPFSRCFARTVHGSPEVLVQSSYPGRGLSTWASVS
jgi:hypothetical protein